MTKKISVEFEEVKICIVVLDLGNLENYKSKFLALRNHWRETSEILAVHNFRNSNSVEVTFLIDEGEKESDEVLKCRDFAEQFGLVVSDRVETAWIINRRETDIDYQLDYKDWFVYE